MGRGVAFVSEFSCQHGGREEDTLTSFSYPVFRMHCGSFCALIPIIFSTSLNFQCLSQQMAIIQNNNCCHGKNLRMKN